MQLCTINSPEFRFTKLNIQRVKIKKQGVSGRACDGLRGVVDGHSLKPRLAKSRVGSSATKRLSWRSDDAVRGLSAGSYSFNSRVERCCSTTDASGMLAFSFARFQKNARVM